MGFISEAWRALLASAAGGNGADLVNFDGKSVGNAATQYTGDLTGDVTGDVTGDTAGTHTGAVTGLSTSSGNSDAMRRDEILALTNKLESMAVLNAIRIAVNGDLAFLGYDEAVVDAFNSETGVDTADSTNEIYDSGNNYYTNAAEATGLEIHLQGEEGDGVTTLTDSSSNGHTVTTNGTGCEADTAQAKFGTGSILNTGGASNLSVTAAAGTFSPAANTDWTMSLFVRWNSQGTGDQWLWRNNIADGTNRAWLRYRGTDTNELEFSLTANSTTYAISATGLTLNTGTWYHVAVCRVGTDLGLYLDGTQVGYVDVTGISSQNLGNIDFLGDGSSEGHNGWVDDVAILTSDHFSASPVVGLTDTITVPTGPTSGNGSDMTLISELFTADTAPTLARFYVLIDETNEALTENTDIKGFVTRDDGTTYTQGTFTELQQISTYVRLLYFEVDISGQPSGTSMRWKITTHNSKAAIITDVGLLWAA